MQRRRDVFHAIADPTRREIIGLISQQALNLNSIADNFGISRPAISQHIKILAECGLIIINKRGRERYCRVELKKLEEVASWIEQCKKVWTRRFTALEKHLDHIQHKKTNDEITKTAKSRKS